ncbi:hypothetical protein [Aureimonas pseudogalii]|uniref:Uncharacterized protein n=1 Tax=Aureimonas pseudogalii TaxID=1744844 RepID=A0A7W6H8J1_9HYPH|nr:hypothetical protein [Aureimonas pseudogalii]MBB4000487.1 hypothetical protein [Aureimonas pseudogalii]
MGLLRLWREAPLWRHAVLRAGLGTVLLAIAPSTCSAPPTTTANTAATGATPPPGSGSYTSPRAQTAAPAGSATPAASSPAPGTAPPRPAAGLTLIPSPSAPKPFVPPVIGPNTAIGPATITAPRATPTPGFGTIRPASPRTLPDAIPPRTLP